MDLHNNSVGRHLAGLEGDIGPMVMQTLYQQRLPLVLHVLPEERWSDA
jgi:hypothetical protein